jgi:hypothetical protein
MWIYTDFDDPHHVQIKEREEFKKNELAPIKERYLRENTWISDFSNFKDQDDLEKKQVRYSHNLKKAISGPLVKIPSLRCGKRDAGANNHVISKKYLKYLGNSENCVKVMEPHKEGLQRTQLKIHSHKVGRKTGSWGFVCESCDNWLFNQVDEGLVLPTDRTRDRIFQAWCDTQAIRSFLASMAVCYRHNISLQVHDKKIDDFIRGGAIEPEPQTLSEGQREQDIFVKNEGPFVYSKHWKLIKEKMCQGFPVFKHYSYFIKGEPSVAGTCLVRAKRSYLRNPSLALDFYPSSMMGSWRSSNSTTGLSVPNENSENLPPNSGIFHFFYIINILPISTNGTMLIFSYLEEHDKYETVTGYFPENPFLRDYKSVQDFQKFVSQEFLKNIEHLPFLVFAPDFLTPAKEGILLDLNHQEPFNLFD